MSATNIDPAGRNPFPVFAESQNQEHMARKLAQDLGCEYAGLLDAPSKSTGGGTSAALVAGKDGLWLEGEGTRIKGDFLTLLPRIRTASLRSELLIKASGINKMEKVSHKPRAIDATAGMGEDSFLLAAAGFTVIMCEKDPIVAALLQDALDRAAEDDRLRDIASRMTLVKGDSISFMQELQRIKQKPGIDEPCSEPHNNLDHQEMCSEPHNILDHMEMCSEPHNILDHLEMCGESHNIRNHLEPCSESHNIRDHLEPCSEPVDVILLDPMFPQRTKSALVKKKFQLIHLLEKPCEDEEVLLQAAMQAEPGRILIKRPAKGPWLANQKPAFSLTGKAIRYDCLLPPFPVKSV